MSRIKEAMFKHSWVKSFPEYPEIKKMSIESPTQLESEAGNDELFESLRGFMIFGRVIGLLPYKGIFSKSSENLKFRWRSIPCFITLIIIFVLTFNCVLEAIQSAKVSKKNAYDITQSIRGTMYCIWGLAVYVYFLMRSNSFFKIFQTWKSTRVFYTKPDSNLKRDVALIATIVLVSGALENTVLYGEYLEDAFKSSKSSLRQKVKENLSTFNLYYIKSHESWTPYVSYNPFFAIIALVQHKFVLFSWNCVDIWIALLSRALYFKFKALVEVSEEHLLQSNKDKLRFSDNPNTIDSKDAEKWLQVVKDHSKLCKLLEAFEDFLSPLIFVSFTINIYYVCMQLLDGITVSIEKNTIYEAINAPWSFIHLVLRIYLVAVCCSRVNIYAHAVAKILHECPTELYSTDLARLDKHVLGGPDIGLTGLGCFTVVKPFILTIVGTIFTFEIILLQVVPPERFGIRNEKNCCC